MKQLNWQRLACVAKRWSCRVRVSTAWNKIGRGLTRIYANQQKSWKHARFSLYLKIESLWVRKVGLPPLLFQPKTGGGKPPFPTLRLWSLNSLGLTCSYWWQFFSSYSNPRSSALIRGKIFK